MSMEYIRQHYGVPARRGARVRYRPERGKPCEGRITGTSGPHLMIRLDGRNRSEPFHPVWNLDYLDA